jgi:hypothetical protein
MTPTQITRADGSRAKLLTGCPFDSRLARTPYLVLPKLAIQVMPLEWRVRFDDMLAEMEAAGIETPSYHVFRDDGQGERYTRARVVNDDTGFVRLVHGERDPWADYRHMQHQKVAALCPRFNVSEHTDCETANPQSASSSEIPFIHSSEIAGD